MNMSDDRPLKSLSDKRLNDERFRIQKLHDEALNSLGEIKTEQMRRALEAKQTS
jgi:3-methyladenine DNA glycosylase AlkD